MLATVASSTVCGWVGTKVVVAKCGAVVVKGACCT